MKEFTRALFIFRRDLRLNDNSALEAALRRCEMVVPCFIFDERQISKKNSYFSPKAFAFMLESLSDLHAQLRAKGGRLFFFRGVAEKVVEAIVQRNTIDALFINKDYTPFSLKRDKAIENVCVREGVAFFSFDDALLHPPHEMLKADGSPYEIFTPFYRAAIKKSVARPRPSRMKNFFVGNVRVAKHQAASLRDVKIADAKKAVIKGGTSNGRKLLRKLGRLKSYTQTKDFPALTTSHLSAHNKFGTLSIREVYAAITRQLGPHHPLVRQLYWRDFFTYVAYYSPFVFGHAFKAKFDGITWKNDRKKFLAWCEGKTGFPIVDAGMRELNQTGFMHNRVRMIVASFLVKNLHVDWRWGERYFAQHLIDYDPAVNNGNWQWAASTGSDAQPYFRIFNPWLQQKKFDSDCSYIKKWVPELQTIPTKFIHAWNKQGENLAKKYPQPIIDFAETVARSKALFKASGRAT